MALKKRMLHLLYSGLGGHGSVFFSLVKADQQRQCSYYAVFSGIEPVRPEYVDKCRIFDIPYAFIQKKKGMDWRVYWKIARAIHKAKPDIVLLHGSSFILTAILSKLLQPSTRIIIRDTQAHHLKTKRDWFWLKWAMRVAQKIIVLTPEAAEGILKKFPSPSAKRKMIVIPNGIDTDIYSPVVKDGRSFITIGMQSRLQAIKDHPTLLRAFKQLKDRMPGQLVRLRIAGDGETMNALRNLTNELSLDNDVEFCGMLNEQDLLIFMQSLDIYVHATQGETMSNSIMQALACGLPVIASDVWGVNNMISDNQNGLLYPSGDIEQLSSLMGELIINSEKSKRLALAAREFALKNYSNHLMFERYKKLYN